jgi:hypothetical protein
MHSSACGKMDCFASLAIVQAMTVWGGARFASAVIPGWSEGPDPESRDSGFDARIAPE